MKLSQFKFDLPPELITKYPPRYRDESKMMVVNRETGKIEHRIFKDILEYFNENDVFAFNNTKVFPARLYGYKEKTDAQIEVFLLRELNKEQRLWDVIVSPARKIRIGNKLYFGENNEMVAEIIDNTTSRGRTIRFLSDYSYEEYKSTLNKIGVLPLPKFLGREIEEEDIARYQTIYAKKEGSIAAPFAGLHFSRELIKRMEIRDIHQVFITLHIGLGSFRQIGVEDLTKYKIDSDQLSIKQEACNVVNNAKKNKHKICIVGSTTMRAIEGSISTLGELTPTDGWTNKFIFPPYNFRIADRMVSSFHFPKSIFFLTVAAFGGFELIMKAYQTAINKKYNFGPYGDAMLII